MNYVFILLLSIFYSVACSQVTNGSFENGSGADLSNWEWTCGAQQHNDAPAGAGSWSLQVSSGNTQGCFPGYAYQKIDGVTNGNSYILSGWAYKQASPYIGIYFGKVNNGVITIYDGDTTSSSAWTPLSIQSGFNLSTGDTALVVLYAGLTGGPVQGYGFFDSISLEQVTTVHSYKEERLITISPVPFSNYTVLNFNRHIDNAMLSIYNSSGQVVKLTKNISGNTFILQRENLSGGLYFIQVTADNKNIYTGRIFIHD